MQARILSERVAMPKAQRRCIFCRGTGLTKEHVWADWLKGYIPKDMTDYSSLSATVHETHAEFGHQKHGGDLRSRTLRVVCKSCNNGWMSQLQQRAKPYLLPLILGDVTAFDARAQEILSAWVAMFVMVAEHFDRYKVVSSQKERRFLWKNQKTPSNWKIWIGDFQKKNWKGLLARFCVPISSKKHRIKRMDNRLPRPNTQAVTFVVGRLYVHVVSSVTDIFEDWHLYRPDLLVQIWPVRRNIVAWPLTTMTDRDADGIAAAFHHFSDEVGRRMVERSWAR
jgi:hypothetical protein